MEPRDLAPLAVDFDDAVVRTLDNVTDVAVYRWSSIGLRRRCGAAGASGQCGSDTLEIVGDECVLAAAERPLDRYIGGLRECATDTEVSADQLGSTIQSQDVGHFFVR